MPVDDHEFGAFFLSHYSGLYALGVLLTGDHGQAEELAQDALVRTYRRWALVGQPDDPASFARRVLINRHRSLLRRGLVEARQLLRLRGDAQPVVYQPEDAVAIWAAVRQLPPPPAGGDRPALLRGPLRARGRPAVGPAAWDGEVARPPRPGPTPPAPGGPDGPDGRQEGRQP